ncbi:UNVERIFIED_CONTAM: hypothetical protein PYX00_010729 [Menopon gallinae]|uniref:MOSC domain-containing protein n=1 Tax=Menopon gallinae TaxID=328185 RepID=A0AAW2HGP7_9NEOP
MHLNLGDRGIILGATAAAATGGILTAFVWYKRWKSSRPPEKWVKIGEVGGLYLYPIKSCKAIKAKALECTELGCKLGELRDRMFVVVNEEGTFVTGREYPQLTQVEASMNEGKFRLCCASHAETVDIDFHALEGSPQKVRIWNAPAEGIDCGDAAARWLSRLVLLRDSGLRLLYYGDRTAPKGMNPKLKKALKLTGKDFKGTDASFFSDAAAYHLISEVSVGELNGRLENENVSPLNFRPNIVVRGEKLFPFEEDNWDWVKIGDVVFRFLSPCGRCLFTTIDPENSNKSDKYEPVTTLKKYRFMRNSVVRDVFKSPAMGIYLGARSTGSVSVGDDVMIPLS